MKNYYIGRRDNPQFSNPYFRAYGRLYKKDAKKKEDCAYGSMTLTEYTTEQEYLNKLQSLKEQGFNVYYN